MKKRIRLFVMFLMMFLTSIQLNSQTINLISENGYCFASPDVASLTGNDGGSPQRNIYEGIMNGIGFPYRIIWDNADSRWEVQVDEDANGVFGILTYSNTFASWPNPPRLGTGTWSDLFGCGGFIQFDGSGTQTSLPVELILFEANISEKSLLLNWQTESEINNEKFEIEESRDGRAVKKIGEVTGGGTTLEQQEYLFEVHDPRNGTSYYRLKQIDFDGQSEYSNVISVNFKSGNAEVGEFYPNPSKSGLVNLDYFALNDDEITVSVFDITRKLVLNQILPISNGNNNLSFNFWNSI
ncbi:MAG: hypothetical protein AAFZ15_31375 [Bacteroidota bacterium]